MTGPRDVHEGLHSLFLSVASFHVFSLIIKLVRVGSFLAEEDGCFRVL